MSSQREWERRRVSQLTRAGQSGHTGLAPRWRRAVRTPATVTRWPAQDKHTTPHCGHLTPRPPNQPSADSFLPWVRDSRLTPYLPLRPMILEELPLMWAISISSAVLKLTSVIFVGHFSNTSSWVPICSSLSYRCASALMANDIRPDSLTILQANLFKWTSWDICIYMGEGGIQYQFGVLKAMVTYPIPLHTSLGRSSVPTEGRGNPTAHILVTAAHVLHLSLSYPHWPSPLLSSAAFLFLWLSLAASSSHVYRLGSLPPESLPLSPTPFMAASCVSTFNADSQTGTACPFLTTNSDILQSQFFRPSSFPVS